MQLQKESRQHLKKGYEALKADHVADHSALFSRMELGV